MTNSNQNIFTAHVTNCLTSAREEVNFSCGRYSPETISGTITGDLFSGPGLVDLQVNGFRGIDFNKPSLDENEILKATQFLLADGVTTYFPTVITNSDENICKILQSIHSACTLHPLVEKCVAGIHLEGPFLSTEAGAKGAHDAKFLKSPDWDLFAQFQQAAGGKIKLITLAPELPGAISFIKKCREQGIIVAVGHSMADNSAINAAVEAGACLSTHLGNGAPLMLLRHPNVIWDQLANDGLYCTLIADGIHLPNTFVKVVQKVKGVKTMLVSDATCFAGMSPGEYETHIGGRVVLDASGRLCMKSSPGFLAGAAKGLKEDVATLVKHQLNSLGEAWAMASGNVKNFLVSSGHSDIKDIDDQVLFEWDGRYINVKAVIKDHELEYLEQVNP